LPMAMVGGDYRLLSVNAALMTLFGQSAADLAGRSLLDLLAEPDRERVRSHLIELEEDGRRELDAQLRLDQRSLPLRLCLTRPAGEVAGFVAEFHHVPGEEPLRRALAGLNNR